MDFAVLASLWNDNGRELKIIRHSIMMETAFLLTRKFMK